MEEALDLSSDRILNEMNMIVLVAGWWFRRNGKKRSVISCRENETRCSGCWFPFVNIGRIPLKPVIHLNDMNILILT